jgi:transposase
MKQKGVRDPVPEGVSHRETTRDERIQIIAFRERVQWSWTKIGKELNIDRNTARRIYERYRQYGTPSNRKRSGRPPIFDAAEKACLEAFVTRDSRTRRLSWEAICIEMGYACDPKTVRNVLKSMGYHKRVPRRKFHVRPDNRPKRVAWCQERLHWTKEEWKRVIWTDESSFSTAGFAHRPWVIRKPGEEDHPDCVDNTFHSGRQTKMVWGAFCGTTKSDLIFVPGKAKIDSATYVRTIMEPALVPFWQQCCEEYGWTIVMEDGAPGHKGYSKGYRELNGIEVLEWPAQSPDLNLIEACWRDIETELGEIWERASDIEILKTMLSITWEQITEERLDRLVDSMPSRLQAVIDAGGAATPY